MLWSLLTAASKGLNWGFSDLSHYSRNPAVSPAVDCPRDHHDIPVRYCALTCDVQVPEPGRFVFSSDSLGDFPFFWESPRFCGRVGKYGIRCHAHCYITDLLWAHCTNVRFFFSQIPYENKKMAAPSHYALWRYYCSWEGIWWRHGPIQGPFTLLWLLSVYVKNLMSKSL